MQITVNNIRIYFQNWKAYWNYMINVSIFFTDISQLRWIWLFVTNQFLPIFLSFIFNVDYDTVCLKQMKIGFSVGLPWMVVKLTDLYIFQWKLKAVKPKEEQK
jgi:RsiW-degrading membrane proteinase PrsW (M82 family)